MDTTRSLASFHGFIGLFYSVGINCVFLSFASENSWLTLKGLYLSRLGGYRAKLYLDSMDLDLGFRPLIPLFLTSGFIHILDNAVRFLHFLFYQIQSQVFEGPIVIVGGRGFIDSHRRTSLIASQVEFRRKNSWFRLFGSIPSLFMIFIKRLLNQLKKERNIKLHHFQGWTIDVFFTRTSTFSFLALNSLAGFG
jgi:hypothetical protein